MAAGQQRLTAEERKNQILECAAGVFAQSNYTAAKVADIARAAEISEATIYKHFASKKEIFLHVLQNHSEGLDRFWKANIDAEDNPLEALKTITIRYYRQIMKHPETLRVQFLALSEVRDRDIRVRLQNDYRHMLAAIETVIEAGMARGVIRKNIDTAAVTNLGLAGGLLTHIMVFLTLKEEYPEKLVEKMVDHLIQSIKTPEPIKTPEDLNASNA